MSDDTQSRRTFLSNAAKASAAAAAAPLVVPRRVVGGAGYQAPSDTLNIAGIGVGGMGQNNLAALAETENIIALCDVDWEYAAETFAEYPEASRYWDYRRMLDEEAGRLDGVVIATPDHTHALATMAAMKRGLNVYTQKPLTWSVWEARQLKEAAARTGVVTQMGNQGHSTDDARLVNEHLRAGTVGEVREVHVWTNRPIWPQGMGMPSDLTRKPQKLNWDLYLGPAPEVAYDPAFHPFSWRGWVDYGTGALGDMGAHLIDHPYWALQLGPPRAVETRATAFNGASYPNAAMTYYDFPERDGRPPVRLTWYSGGLQPPRPEELPDDEALNAMGGVLYVGSEGKLLHDTYGANPRFLPLELDRDRPDVPRQFERVENEAHEMNWARAIKGQAQAVSPFSYAAPLTEAMLLGVVSLKADTRKIVWDADDLRVTNRPEANEYLRRDPRDGWSLPA
jgi:predicted dehydrogenase